MPEASNHPVSAPRPPATVLIRNARLAGAAVHTPAVSPTHTLRGLATALNELDAGTRRYVRIAHYGDSNIAAGLWTKEAREQLQRRYGNGGPGLLTVLPYGSRSFANLRLVSTDAEGRRHASKNRFGPDDGLWGAAGVAAEVRAPDGRVQLVRKRPGPTATLSPPTPSSVTFHLLGFPHGGIAALVSNGVTLETQTTKQNSPELLKIRVPFFQSTPPILVRSQSVHPVRVLGAVVESETGGLVYETLGINGQRASALPLRNRALWAAAIEGRQPDLVVMSFGGNEALDPSFSGAAYEDQLERALARVRALMPSASCLLTGPVSMCDHPPLAEVVAVQRRVAPRYGCGFWDTREVSGGENSNCTWRKHGLVSGDGLHLSPEGYDIVGDRFAEALLKACGFGPPSTPM